jgi:hypothetical protein
VSYDATVTLTPLKNTRTDSESSHSEACSPLKWLVLATFLKLHYKWVTLAYRIKEYSNLFQASTGISNRILASLPANLVAELRGLVGEKAALYEPTIHSLRRIALQRQLGKPETQGGEESSMSPEDEDWGKWTVDAVSIALFKSD